MDENNANPIGEAQPIDPRQGWKILKRMGAIVSITVGGAAAFAFLLTPTRLSGASRSARLIWQNRQKEISETIQGEHAALPKSEQSARDEEQAGAEE